MAAVITFFSIQHHIQNNARASVQIPFSVSQFSSPTVRAHLHCKTVGNITKQKRKKTAVGDIQSRPCQPTSLSFKVLMITVLTVVFLPVSFISIIVIPVLPEGSSNG